MGAMRLIILGSGVYNRIVADITNQLNYNPIIFLGDSISRLPISHFINCIFGTIVHFAKVSSCSALRVAELPTPPFYLSVGLIITV